MIEDRRTYRGYRRKDLAAHGLTRVGLYNYMWMDCVRFQLRLRRIEYLYNTKKNNPLKALAWFVEEVVQHWESVRLGFTIPKNVFGAGLCIVHRGTIVVSNKARVGDNCRIHPGTSIGDYDGAPEIGDNVYIGPGAKIFGPIKIGNNTAIGANAVVNRSFEGNGTLAGIPAQRVSELGALEQGVFGERGGNL